jgi:hypothetical protein
MFDNMDLLVAYINANMSSALHVRYGTLSEYFAAVGALPAPDPAAWPTFTRDYVPFEDNPWAGWWVCPRRIPRSCVCRRRCACMCVCLFVRLSLSLSLPHTHKQTHTH